MDTWLVVMGAMCKHPAIGKMHLDMELSVKSTEQHRLALCNGNFAFYYYS